MITTCAYKEATRRMIEQALSESGGLILDDAVPANLVNSVTEIARSILANPGALERLPYDPARKAGYTPPGIEGTKSEGPNFERHFLDYRLGDKNLPVPIASLGLILHVLGHTILKELSSEAAGAGKLGDHFLRATQYLNTEVDAGKVIFPEHLDFGLLTLFIGTSDQGLQVKIGERWEDVTVLPGQVLIGTGSVLRQYRPDFKAFRHRVTARSMGRISLFLFLEPGEDVRLPNGETWEQFLSRLLRGIRTDHQ